MANLEEIFLACDVRRSGYLEQEQLRELCSRFEIGQQDADALFEDLDCDSDGKITYEDFAKGFSEFLGDSTSNSRSRDSLQEENSYSDGKRQTYKNKGVKIVYPTSSLSKGNVSNKVENSSIVKGSSVTMYERMGLEQLSQSALEDLLEEMKRLQDENRKLEENWQREKREHERHLHVLEEELEGQVQEVEHRAKMKAREEADEEKKSIKLQMNAEIDQFQANLLLFEKMDSLLKANKSSQQDEKMTEIKHRLDESTHENRQLRMSLMDTQTNVALMRSELAQLRTQYEEKCRELNGEKEKIMEVMHEQDHLAKQLHILHDANTRLQDTNDTLRIVLESSATIPPKKTTASWMARAKRGSVVGDYLMPEPVSKPMPMIRSSLDLHVDPNESFGEESIVSKPRSEDLELMSYRMQRFVKELDINGAHSDSGLSMTIRDCDDIDDEEIDKLSPRDRSCKGSGPLKSSSPKPSVDHSGSESPKIRNVKRTGSSASTASVNSALEGARRFFTRESATNPVKAEAIDSEEDVECSEPTGPPETTYKVIFIGDAAVGKSSFILRLARGTFVQQLSSTLGVDFHMRTLRVAKRNVALQLWDTAGQERFRSITKSYFRKADGIMLLYDCTSEKSFLNVKHWLEAVEEGADGTIPIMIVGNKIDLRPFALASGESVISTQTGDKMARDAGAIFTESSAKEGINVMEAVGKLTKLMAANEDREIRASGMHLKKGKKSGLCCGS